MKKNLSGFFDYSTGARALNERGTSLVEFIILLSLFVVVTAGPLQQVVSRFQGDYLINQTEISLQAVSGQLLRTGILSKDGETLSRPQPDLIPILRQLSTDLEVSTQLTGFCAYSMTGLVDRGGPFVESVVSSDKNGNSCGPGANVNQIPLDVKSGFEKSLGRIPDGRRLGVAATHMVTGLSVSFETVVIPPEY